MEKRHSERIPAKLGIQLFSNNRTIYGRLENCSDRGLYIKAMISFPFDSTFEVLIPLIYELDDDLNEELCRDLSRGHSLAAVGEALRNEFGNCAPGELSPATKSGEIYHLDGWWEIRT